MTDPNKTLVAALLDRSGSMSSSKEATEDGWRELLNEQKKQPGQCLVTLGQFDRPGGFYDPLEGGGKILEWVYRSTDVQDVPEFVLTPRGSTPLNDATYQFITQIGEDLASLSEDERPGTVICIIMTDGHENSSTQYSLQQVKDLITQQREKYNWKFMFLGANIDAISVGTSMGFTRGSTITFDSHDYTSNRAVYAAAASNVSGLRSGLVPDADFSDEDRKTALGQNKKNKK